MQTGLLHLHNFLRWIIFVLLVLSIVKSFMGVKSKKSFDSSDKKIWLFTMIAAHITLLLGLYQWLLGRYGILSYVKQEGISNPYLRFFQMEHPVSMLLSIIFITLGYGMAKKNVDDSTKYKKALRYFVLAFILILVAVPWPFRELVARPLFPGM